MKTKNNRNTNPVVSENIQVADTGTAETGENTEVGETGENTEVTGLSGPMPDSTSTDLDGTKTEVVEDEKKPEVVETKTEVVEDEKKPEVVEDEKKPEVVETKPAPAAPRILAVDSPIKKALFDNVLRKELSPGGRWGGKSQQNLSAPWTDIVVIVVAEGEPTGRTFDAQKGNWNFNDSNWVNPTENYSRLARVAREANGGVEVDKKKLVGHLEDLKKTCIKMLSPEQIAAILLRLEAGNENVDGEDTEQPESQAA